MHPRNLGDIECFDANMQQVGHFSDYLLPVHLSNLPSTLGHCDLLPPFLNNVPRVSAIVIIIEDGLVVNVIELFESALGESTIISLS